MMNIDVAQSHLARASGLAGIPKTSRPRGINIPWRAVRGRPTTDTAVVQVTRLQLASAKDIPSFLVVALRIRRAVINQPGALGVSLKAQPFRMTFWTLSAWEDEDVLRQFVIGEAHLSAVRAYRDRMAGTHFHAWTIAETSNLPPRWAEAVQRVGDLTNADNHA